MTENAKALKLYAETSDAAIYAAMQSSLRMLRSHVDRVARDLAKHRAGWMDDPDDERYEAWHASADEQFTEADRLKVLRSMLRHQIEELLIQEEANVTASA